MSLFPNVGPLAPLSSAALPATTIGGYINGSSIAAGSGNIDGLFDGYRGLATQIASHAHGSGSGIGTKNGQAGHEVAC